MDGFIDALGAMEKKAHSEPSRSSDGRDYIARRVTKEFEGGVFEGTVTAFSDRQWTVRYDADGVTEDFIWDELKLLMLAYDSDALVEEGEDHIGKKIKRQFGKDWYEGEVISTVELDGIFAVEYDDGDSDECSWQDMQMLPQHPFSRMARARLKIIHDAGEKLKAHKCRFANQDAYKELITTFMLQAEELGWCYVLVDYWAKLPARLKDTGCCENLGKGISVLGTMFVSRNPNMAERLAISEENPDFDWAPFGTAPDDTEEPGAGELVEFINLVDQNATQTAYHTACSMNAAFAKFKQGRPWFKNRKRCFFVQSDGASKHEEQIVLFIYF
jgi:hypothetical protein